MPRASVRTANGSETWIVAQRSDSVADIGHGKILYSGLNLQASTTTRNANFSWRKRGMALTRGKGSQRPLRRYLGPVFRRDRHY
jgi:hypothetical protein